jgi:uncharacterized protein with HEPN domain
MRVDEETLLDLAQACRRIAAFLGRVDEAAFLEDEKTQSAVTHQILVIGEAVKRLSPEFRQSHPEVPWNDMAGMRDRLIHAYDVVDIEEVWRTATRDVPSLLKWTEPRLPREEP